MKAHHALLAGVLFASCASPDAEIPAPHEGEGAGGSGGSHSGAGGTGGGGSGGGTEAPALPPAQAAHLADLVEDFVAAQKYPNLAIGVVRGADLVWHAGFGAGVNPDVPPGAQTFFRAGSITKVVTATALLDLVEEGALSLDDEAAAWIPEAEGVLSPDGRPAITLRHLLAHASGLPRDGGVSLGAGPTEADVLAALDGVELSFDPGTASDYSNLGAGLAGIVVSRASGTSYRAAVQERVLDPLGMDASIWDPPSTGLAPGHHHVTVGRGYERPAST